MKFSGFVSEALAENPVARQKTDAQNLLESVADESNLRMAWERVRKNHGAPGIDGEPIEAFGAALSLRLPTLQSDLLAGTFRPQPVRAFSVPKSSGGTRTLGIPAVVDRLVLEAISLVLAPLWEPTFSPNSFAYRERRGAQQAVELAQSQLETGRHWVVDLDVEGFFDHVDHVRLMLRLGQRVNDTRLLDLVADFLRAGRRFENGTVEQTHVGIAQGSPLSPLLANIVLDEMDQEFASHGWPFVRYADDFILLANSEPEGKAMMAFTEGFLNDRLRLRLNPLKSRVVPPEATSFLGFTYRLTRYGRVRRGISAAALDRFRNEVRQLTAGHHHRSLDSLMHEVARFVRGWSVYYGIDEGQSLAKARAFARTRLRAAAWEYWRTPAERRRQLIQRGVPATAVEMAVNRLTMPDEETELPVLQQALPNSWFDQFGLGPGGDTARQEQGFLSKCALREDVRALAVLLSTCSTGDRSADGLRLLSRIYQNLQRQIGSRILSDLPELPPRAKPDSPP